MNNEIDAHLPEHDEDDDEKLEKFDEFWRGFMWESDDFAWQLREKRDLCEKKLLLRCF